MSGTVTSNSPMMQRALQATVNSAIADGDAQGNMYLPALEDIILNVFTSLSTDPLISGADQAVFVAQLALAARDSI